MKTTWFPRPHNSAMTWYNTLSKDSLIAPATICPLVMYDEGKGNPNSYNSNPANSAFAETDEPNCYPESKIEKIQCHLNFRLTTGAINVDKIPVIKVGFMPIFTSFDDIDAKDEVSGETIGTVLELQSEDTDRQTYPLWNGTDMGVHMTGLNILPASVPGLTATQAIEEVDFDIEKYYDALQYYTISDKLKKCQGGLKWLTLTAQKPFYDILINLRNKSKFMNQYNFAGILTVVPVEDTIYSGVTAAVTTNIAHVYTTIKTRYNEWNEHFDHART